MEFISAHLSEIVAAIVGAIGGAAISVPITIRVKSQSSSGNSTHVDQSESYAGDDMVGGNKSTHYHGDTKR